jgi:hypothetical protein
MILACIDELLGEVDWQWNGKMERLKGWELSVHGLGRCGLRSI